jgi:hypothetical protein
VNRNGQERWRFSFLVVLVAGRHANARCALLSGNDGAESGIALLHESSAALRGRQREFTKGAKMSASLEIEPFAEGTVPDNRVDETVRRRINDCPYKFIFGKVTWRYVDGQLTLFGCVPSFHLKQLLQELLRGVEQVTQITNSVDVVSSTGLSSERSDIIGCTRTI